MTYKKSLRYASLQKTAMRGDVFRKEEVYYIFTRKNMLRIIQKKMTHVAFYTCHL